MTLVIKAQEFFLSTIGNVHLTLLNEKSQVVLELVSPLTLWIIWKQRCRVIMCVRGEQGGTTGVLD